MNNMPEIRRGILKKLLDEKKYIRVMEASNGLMGLIVENIRVKNKEFDAMWLSSLCDSTFKGKPDNETVDFTSRLNTINEILDVTSKPIIVDGDTGGKVEHFVDYIKTLERLGVSAIIIEDKKGLKQNSILGDRVEHVLEDKEIFSEKIKKGKKALKTKDFMIFARIESFIAGEDIHDAISRAETYVKAGADGIMIHSYKKDGKEIIDFLTEFKSQYPNIITILVPTTYAQFKESELSNYGANVIIYANQFLRSAYVAMEKTAKSILENERSYEASNKYCSSMEDILNIIGDKND